MVVVRWHDIDVAKNRLALIQKRKLSASRPENHTQYPKWLSLRIFMVKTYVRYDADGANIVAGGGAPWNAHINMQTAQFTVTMNIILLFICMVIIQR